MIDLDSLEQSFKSDIASAKTDSDFEAVKNKFLGRKQGLLTEAFAQFTALPLEQKKALGPKLNALRKEFERQLQNKSAGQLDSIAADMSVPPLHKQVGHLHPLTQVQKKLEEIFSSLGFWIVQGPEIETDWYNFTSLNFPEFHPARDMQDTFFIKDQKDKLVLRTHTSPMQVRFMEKHKPPFAIVVPGTVYRNEATDATHEHTIEQLEGLVVGETINFANMVWTITEMMKKFFGSDAKTRIAPTYFPFVEPGAEMLMSSPNFKDGRWIEMGGCGMVHQNVFAAAGYPKNKYQGFAFGFGSIRFPLMKHGIPDIRLLHENDLRFLEQF
jgi:phenylalanyl-tRNA synthetase alpha chain